ncbi:MAG: NYN domain-containing protein [Methylococcaceae bacterium]|nr:NYN domain-containing protein [Methylococcaceae bacterium]
MSKPLKNYAILIDAGFLKRKLGSQENPATAEKIIDFAERLKRHEILQQMSLHRIYYYDSPPLTERVKVPLSTERMNFATTPLAKNNSALLQKLSHAPYFALRLGEVAFRGWKLNQKILNDSHETITISKDDLSPNITQKGVDMRIGLDIASLTLKKQAHVIVLVTGDSDFVPAMKFARREGAQLFLVCLGHEVKDDLIQHSDMSLKIDLT